jgi:SAM-dependent methyltransferase
VTGGASPLDYAAWSASRLGTITERLERTMLREITGPLAGLEVLDVGTGDAAHAVALAGEGAQVTGVDVSLPALRAGVIRSGDAGARLPLVAGDAVALPFGSGTFDVAMAVAVLCLTRAPTQAVAELARVVRPGGRVVLGELGRWSTWAAWRRVRGWLGAAPWRDARFWTATGLRRLAASAGLVPGPVRGAIFYPPGGLAAASVASLDPVLGRATTLGAAFLAMSATKPGAAPS